MRGFFVALFAVALALAAVGLVFAHAEPNIVSPGNGAVLNTPPTAITFETTQDMARESGANTIVVLNASGQRVNTQDATIDNTDRKKLSVPLPPNLPVGKYTVNWTTLSADDGDTASGTLSFTYDPAQTPTAGVTELVPNLINVSPTPQPSPAPSKTAAAATGAGGSGGGSSGVTWIVVVAVGAGMFALGGGSVFLFGRGAS